MNIKQTTLPGVKSIGWIDARRLPRRVDLTGICGAPLPILTDIHPITFYGTPECRCQHKKDGAGYEDTASLKFRTAAPLPEGIPLAFIVTDVNDTSFLIGSLEPPLPIVEHERHTGIPSTDPAGFQYEVKHVALKTLIPCDV